VRCIGKRDPLHTPVCLWRGTRHSAGCDPAEAAHNAVIVEEIAALALQTLIANHKAGQLKRRSTKNISSASMEKRHTTDRSRLLSRLFECSWPSLSDGQVVDRKNSLPACASVAHQVFFSF